MVKKEWIALVLAGGRGTRLQSLTADIAKPAVPFGGNYRLIDFTVSNCVNSEIDRIGILTSTNPLPMLERIDWSHLEGSSSLYSLPPQGKSLCHGMTYKGTASAICSNIPFIEQYDPDYLLILSGDHIYKMDYRDMLSHHKETGSVATIAVTGVPWSEASRFGIMNTRSDGAITDFVEKPPHPQSNFASMGVYIFNWSILKQYLLTDEGDDKSCHDFGKNIIPAMLSQGEKMYAYPFRSYWKDVGTVESLYDAHMDLLGSTPILSLADLDWPLYRTVCQDIGKTGMVADQKRNSLIHGKSSIYGDLAGSVVFHDVHIHKNAVVKNAVVMPGAVIRKGAYVERAIVGPGALIGEGYILKGGIDGVPTVAVAKENRKLTAEEDYSANILLAAADS